MAFSTSKSWLAVVFLILGYLNVCCSALHRMEDKFAYVDRSCAGRVRDLDETWAEYRALATETHEEIKANNPRITVDLMLRSLYGILPDPHDDEFVEMQGK